MKILAIEDDGDTLEHISKGLGALGHTVDGIGDGQEGLDLSNNWHYDVIILDRMLPSLDGMDVLRKMRASGNKSPVLFLTALGGVSERVMGLEAGADDYLVKPFAFSELVARVHALGRRPVLVEEAKLLVVHDLEMDLRRRSVRRGDKLIELRPTEFKILEYLMRNSPHVVTRAMLLEHVWGYGFDPKTKMIETNMSRLRTKIDKDYDVALIHTIRTAGYSLYAED